MSRWHLRLAEIRESRQDPGQDPASVQNVQNGQNVALGTDFGHSGHFDQPKEHARADRRTGKPCDAGGEVQGACAAIVQESSGSSTWAEVLTRLDPTRVPADIPENRWLLFIHACKRFGAEGWADKAMALGWELSDLMGCDRTRPYGRIDRLGLLWFLKDYRRIIVLAKDAVGFETATGAQQTYYKVPVAFGEVVLPWELPTV